MSDELEQPVDPTLSQPDEPAQPEAVGSDTPADPLEQAERTLQGVTRWAFMVLVVVLGLVAGVLISQAVFPRPVVGIVRLYGIIDLQYLDYYFAPLQDAYDRWDVKAVVIFIDSPGGDAAVSEELFYAITRLRGRKPVVASVEGLAASGAYYAAAATNYIVARPATQIGSIGVITSFRPTIPPDEETLVTGPFKGSGSLAVDTMRDAEAIKEVFVTNVYDQRAYVLENMHEESRLDLLPAPEMLTTGQVWAAPRALEIGLIDALGSNQDAIAKAASLAKITNYEIVDLLASYLEIDDAFAGYQAGEEPAEDWRSAGPWVEFQYLYVPPGDEPADERNGR